MSTAPSNEVLWGWITSLSCAGSYMLTYFWRYPVFVLPPDILHQPVVGTFDLQACFSLAFIVGFAVAKIPAASIAARPFFFRHRLRVLLALMTLSMAIEGFGLLSGTAAVMIVAVFAAATLSSFLWGMMLTYLEGRRATERHVAVATLCLIYAGNASRGIALTFSFESAPGFLQLARHRPRRAACSLAKCSLTVSLLAA